MDIKEIEQQINELKQTIILASIQLDKIERSTKQMMPANKNVRWKPEVNQKYWYVDSTGEVTWECWQSIKRDIYRYYVGNCFRYQCEASEYKELLEAKQALKDLALELNAGREIDWSDDSQNKYQIILDENDNLYPNFLSSTQSVGQVHCLDGHFLDMAKVSIGQEKLIRLIKSGI